MSAEKMEEQVTPEGGETKPNIVNEFQELGRQLAAMTKAVLESPEAQDAATQVRKGLEALEKTVGQLATQARETKVGQKVEAGVSEVTATVKDKHVFETLSDTFAGALRTVNQALGQAVEKAEQRAQDRRPAPQQIEVVQAEAGAETEE
jgi:hypothetical protein